MQRKQKKNISMLYEKKYNGGLSSAEIQTKHAIEQGYYDGDEAEQQAVYDEIERREADIEAGKFDHYKQ